MAVYWNDELVFGTEPDSNSASRLINESKSLDEVEMSVFPNPTSNQLWLDVPSRFIEKRAFISIVDLSGREVLSTNMILEHSQEVQLSIPQGVYLIEIRIPELNQTWIQRIIKN